MQLRSTYKFVAFSIVASVIFVFSYNYVPAKRVQLYPAPAGEVHTFNWTNESEGGDSKIRILGEAPATWQCEIGNKANFPICGFGFYFLAGNQGIDFSRYSSVAVKLSVDSPDRRIRISLKSWLGDYSLEHNRTEQFNYHIAELSESGNEIVIDLDKFVVADWWMAQLNPPKEYNFPDLHDVRSIGFEIGTPPQPGVHTLTVERVELRGRFVSMDAWLQGLLIAWLVLVIPYVIYRYLRVQKQLDREQRQLERMAYYTNQLNEERERFKELSLIDNLTGVLNRNGFDEALIELTTALAGNQKAALIVVDLDHFKRINDTRGHDVGDEVLRVVAATLKANLRSTDYLARWGGEEFVVLSPFSQEAKAFALAEKLRAAVAGIELDLDPPLKITASLGVGCFSTEDSFEHAFKRVDSALYEAKHLGRNCTVLAED